MDDEEVTMQRLNKLCGEKIYVEEIGMSREASMKSKIFSHFIKGKIFLSSVETILMIPREQKHLESLVKLIRQKWNSEFGDNQTFLASTPLTTHKICINKIHRSKTLHSMVEINNYVVEGLINTKTFMSMMVVAMVKELGIMHLVSKVLKITKLHQKLLCKLQVELKKCMLRLAMCNITWH